MSSGPEYLADAADELVAAATRWRRTRQRRRQAVATVATTAVIAIAALVGLDGLGSKDASAERVTISQGSDGFQLATIDEGAPAADIINELQLAGIKVQRTEVPVGPSLVGHATSIISTSGQTSDGSLKVAAGSIVDVEVGVAAGPGVEYQQPSLDAFAPGEPLHCLGQVGSDAAALATRIPPDVTVKWMSGPGVGSPITERDLGGMVVDGTMSTKANSVLINVVEGSGPTTPPIC